jgi:hypothetical protein
LPRPAAAEQVAPTGLASLVSLERQCPAPATALAAQAMLDLAAQAAPVQAPLEQLAEMVPNSQLRPLMEAAAAAARVPPA